MAADRSRALSCSSRWLSPTPAVPLNVTQSPKLALIAPLFVECYNQPSFWDLTGPGPLREKPSASDAPHTEG